VRGSSSSSSENMTELRYQNDKRNKWVDVPSRSRSTDIGSRTGSSAFPGREPSDSSNSSAIYMKSAHGAWASVMTSILDLAGIIPVGFDYVSRLKDVMNSL